MNKYQEALEELRNISASKRQNELYDFIQELVDKETPMKPIMVGLDYKCGKCHKFTVLDKSKPCCEIPRCYTCGTRIDWSDEE